jgi:hypothetical protein
MYAPKEQPLDLARYPGAEQPRGIHATDIAGGLLSIIWVIAVGSYLWRASPSQDGPSLGLMMTLLVLFLPLALIWVAIATLRTARALRAEASRLRAAVDAMHNSYVASQQMQAAGGMRQLTDRRTEDLVIAARQPDIAPPSFASRRDTGLTIASADRKVALVAPQAQPGDEEPRLALGTPAEDLRAPLSITDFIRAMNFPETPDDKEGFRAMRRALEDRIAAKLVRAAQDVLTLLSQDGIYMDDLKPDLAKPEVWRRFAAGERGRSIAALGGIRDRSSLALTASRMREDMVFRDAGHHFLRTFDKTLAMIEPNASDVDLAELADTRTARAFMVFGRVTGIFD